MIRDLSFVDNEDYWGYEKNIDEVNLSDPLEKWLLVKTDALKDGQ